MKTLFLATIIVIFVSCEKTPDRNICDTFLVIDSTSTPKTSTVAVGISSIIDCYGANLCYSYTGMDVAAKSGNVFEINAKGTINCEAQVCAQALYQVRDTIQINTTAAGTYYLKFYNSTSLVKTDTITVN
jgi:hypothetical protein